MANSREMDHLQVEDRSYNMEESRTLLAEFKKAALNPRYVYAHDWKSGDLVIWDNFGMWYSATGGSGNSKKLRLASL